MQSNFSNFTHATLAAGQQQALCQRLPAQRLADLGGGGGMLSLPFRLMPSMASTCGQEEAEASAGR
jgi:hypothetical protein